VQSQQVEKKNLTMSNKRSFPGPIPILMVVIILSAIATWLLPAGQYNKLSGTDRSFVLTSSSGDTNLPLTQKTLDSLGIIIPIQKFIDGDIRKPVSVPGTFIKQKKKRAGIH
jgi:uncharacterized ion transporter superfamily protein YfcC